MGLGGEGPRGYEAGYISGLGNDAAEPGVAVKYAVLTPLCTNLALAVKASPSLLLMALLLTLLLKSLTSLLQSSLPP